MNVKIDFGAKLIDLDGDPLFSQKLNKHGENVQLTLRELAINAVTASYEEEKNMDGAGKFKRYSLAQKINGAEGSAEFTVEEAAEIRKLIGMGYSIAAMGAAWSELDRQSEESNKSGNVKPKK